MMKRTITIIALALAFTSSAYAETYEKLTYPDGSIFLSYRETLPKSLTKEADKIKGKDAPVITMSKKKILEGDLQLYL